MPLEEISSNECRKAGRSLLATPASDYGGSPKAKPDVVSSMLKTSTEVGNLGCVAVPSPRLLRSAPYLPKQSTSAWLNVPANTSRPSQRRRVLGGNPHVPKHTLSSSALSRQGTDQSSSSSYRSNPRLRSHDLPRYRRGRSRGSTLSNSPGAHNYRVLGNSKGRPASPALSDARSMPVSSGRPSLHRAPSTTTDISSPSPAFSSDYPDPYRRWNNSASTLRRFPSPVMPGGFPQTGKSRVPSPYATRISKRPHMPACPTSSAGSFRLTQRSVTRSRTPLYYDYTEAFAEEVCQIQGQHVPAHPLRGACCPLRRERSAEAQPAANRMQEPIFYSAEMLKQQDLLHSGHLEQRARGSHAPSEVERNGSSKTANSLNNSSGKHGTSPDSTCSKASQPTSTKVSLEAEGISRTSQELPRTRDGGSHRCSGLSYRTCPASPSTLFFPSASRSSRDLTSLAARAHNPTPNSTSLNDIKAVGEHHNRNKHPRPSLGYSECGDLDWELPAPHLRPLSGSRHVHDTAESQGSSAPPVRSNAPGIVCPTPERPTSTESRRKFSKILDLGDLGCTSVYRLSSLSRSSSRASEGKTKGSTDSIEGQSQTECLIRPFPPREPVNRESHRDNQSNVKSSHWDQGPGCKTSTVELLSDKHIKCLGLRSDRKASSAKDIGELHHNNAQKPGVPSDIDQSSLISKQQDLAPSSLFSHDSKGDRKLSATQSAPCISHQLLGDFPRRASDGCNTVPFLSDSPLLGLASRQNAGACFHPHTKAPTPKTQFQLGPTALLRSSLSRTSRDSEDVFFWDGDVREGPASFLRQRTRVRLKLTGNAQAEGQFGAGVLSSTDESSASACSLSQNRPPVPHPFPEQDGQRTKRSQILRACVGPNVQRAEASETKPTVPSLPIPTQQSDSLASAVLMIRPQVDRPRSPLFQNHHGNACIGEEIQSIRLTASAPHLDTPDLGHPPTSTSLNKNCACPLSGISAAPNLRSMQSFFSDDSSAKRHPRVSIRKRFKLPSLRSGSHPSTRAQTVTLGTEYTDRHRPLRSWRKRGSQLGEEKDDARGTTSTSKFAQDGKKIGGQFKHWWRKNFTRGRRA